MEVRKEILDLEPDNATLQRDHENAARAYADKNTEHAVMTLTTALHLKRGGNPMGPVYACRHRQN